MKSKVLLMALLSVMLLIIAFALGISEKPSETTKIGVEVAKTLGATGLAVVILNLWIETSDWVQYINERLKSILVEQDYMSGMDRKTLDTL